MKKKIAKQLFDIAGDILASSPSQSLYDISIDIEKEYKFLKTLQNRIKITQPRLYDGMLDVMSDLMACIAKCNRATKNISQEMEAFRLTTLQSDIRLSTSMKLVIRDVIKNIDDIRRRICLIVKKTRNSDLHSVKEILSEAIEKLISLKGVVI